MNRKDLRVMIVGAGIGGLTAALTLQRFGFQVTVFEQAAELRELGAGILVTPNAMHALHFLGIGEALVQRSTPLGRNATRHYASGEIVKIRPNCAYYVEKYGAEFLHVHRNDLHSLLCAAILRNDASAIRVGHRFADLTQDETGVTARFANGETARGDVLVGADGCASSVRVCLQGEEPVKYSGQVAFRALVPMAALPAHALEPPMGLYLGPKRIFLHYPLRHGELMNLIAIAREPTWAEEGWAIPAQVQELLDLYHDFHPNVRAVFAAIPSGSLFKWGLRDREPMAQWTRGRVTMLGDAAHPISPFLGQGACVAVEDGLVLGRCFDASATLDEALTRYEGARKEQANSVQVYSRQQADAYQGIVREGVNLGRDAESLGLYAYNPVTAPV